MDNFLSFPQAFHQHLHMLSHVLQKTNKCNHIPFCSCLCLWDYSASSMQSSSTADLLECSGPACLMTAQRTNHCCFVPRNPELHNCCKTTQRWLLELAGYASCMVSDGTMKKHPAAFLSSAHLNGCFLWFPW